MLLNAIIGFSEIMNGELMGPLGSPIYQEDASDIHESGRHLLAIINDILDLSRVEAGQTALNELMIELQKLVTACLILVRGKAHAGGLTISVEGAGRRAGDHRRRATAEADTSQPPVQRHQVHAQGRRDPDQHQGNSVRRRDRP